MEKTLISNSNFFILSLIYIFLIILSLNYNIIFGLTLVSVGLFTLWMYISVPQVRRKKRL